MFKPLGISLFLISIGAFCTICSCSFLASPAGIAIEEEVIKDAIEIAEEELAPSKS